MLKRNELSNGKLIQQMQDGRNLPSNRTQTYENRWHWCRSIQKRLQHGMCRAHLNFCMYLLKRNQSWNFPTLVTGKLPFHRQKPKATNPNIWRPITYYFMNVNRLTEWKRLSWPEWRLQHHEKEYRVSDKTED